MNIVLPTQDIVIVFRDDLQSMSCLDWDMDELLTLAVGAACEKPINLAAHVSLVQDLSHEVVTRLSNLPSAAHYDAEDREVLRLALVSFTMNLRERMRRIGVMNNVNNRFFFNCLVDDDIVVSQYIPLTT